MIAKENFWIFSISLVILLFVITPIEANSFPVKTNQENHYGYEIIKLIELIKAQIIEPENLEETTKSAASMLLNKLKIELKQIGKTDLKQILNNNSSELMNESVILKSIYQHSEIMFGEIYKELMNEIYNGDNEINLGDLIRYTRGILDIEQSLLGFITIFQEMKMYNMSYNREIFNLAHHIKDIKSLDNYLEVSDIKKLHVENLIADLPICLKNIINSRTVDIRNVGKNEYMYAASGSRNEYLKDKERRFVFTWGPHERVNQGVWRMEHIREGIYYLVNTFHNEYLYAETFDFNGDRRYVFTWIPGGPIKQSEFKIELEPDYCYIKSVLWDEYVFASSYKKDRDRSYVFTWGIKGKLETDRYFGWVIEVDY